MKSWQDSVPDLAEMHAKVDPHWIYKYHSAGHAPHAWYLRTRPNIRTLFGEVWNVRDAMNDLVVGFDGSAFVPKESKHKDNIWTHSDQAPKHKGLTCYQGLAALTSNSERTLVVYERSHLLHSRYFDGLGRGKSTSAFQRALPSHLLDKDVVPHKRVLNVPAGSVVLWDSRVLHQNQNGAPESEERRVQYICYLPKNNPRNTPAMQKKRRKYLNERRTTSHWPYPIKVNGMQPQTYGDSSRLIDLDSVPRTDLTPWQDEIEKMI